MNVLESLAVFYSRTGRTRELARRIQAPLEADAEEILDTKNRAGSLSYLKSALDMILKRPAMIEEPKSDPSLYDAVIAGTPVWVGTMSTLIRRFLSGWGATMKKAAFFCTCDSGSNGHTFKDMENLCKRADRCPRAQERRSLRRQMRRQNRQIHRGHSESDMTHPLSSSMTPPA